MCISTVAARYTKGKHGFVAHVPCGHCYECVRKRKLDWEIRLTVEASVWSNKFFGMLTYADEHYHSEVDHKELAYFIKRLRYNLDKYYPGAKLKYFLVSEYGELKDRLHYHVLYFVSKEFDDTFREFQELVELSWVKKVPLSEEDIQFRRDIYKKNRKRLSDEKRKELFKWSRRKYDDVPIGFATAQNLRHGSAIGSISYACKYIQKQYNKMYYSRMGYDVWRNYAVKEGVLQPCWNRDVVDKIAAAHPYEFVGKDYPTFPVRGKRYPVPSRWMLATCGKYHTSRLKKKLADECFELNGVKTVDFNRQAYFEFKEPERMLQVTLKHEQTMLSRKHHYECLHDFDNDELSFNSDICQIYTTLKPSSPCPVEVESTSVIEIPLPLKWLS